MYYLLLRLVIIFFIFLLQGCRPQLQGKDSFGIQAATAKNSPKPSVLLDVITQEASELRKESCNTHLMQDSKLSASLFTAFSGEQVRFLEVNGDWQAQVSWLGGVKNLPVVYEHQEAMLPMIQRFSKQSSSIHKYSIHLIPSPQGQCVFLGKLGLLGGARIQAAGSLYLALHEVAKRRNIKLIKQLLNNFPDPNKANEDGLTRLHSAAKEGHSVMVKTLLSRGADPNRVDAYDCTPLHYAAMEGHVSVVKTLLLSGQVQPNRIDTYGYAPLHYAVMQGHIKVVKALLELTQNLASTRRVDPNKPNAYHFSPLQMAAEHGDLATAVCLLDAGANVNGCAQSDRLPLCTAVRNNDIAMVDLFTHRDANLNIAEIDGTTALHWAAIENNLPLISFLLVHGAEVDAPDLGGMTPLHYAAKYGHVAAVDCFLAYEAQATMPDIGGMTPLHYAAKHGHVAVVDRFLAYETSVDNFDTCGMAPLHHAAEHGHIEIVKMLITQTDAGLPTANELGDTVLHIAAYRGNLALANFLLEVLNVDLSNAYGYTPLRYATGYGHLAMVEQLKNKGANYYRLDQDGNSILHIAARRGHVTLVSQLLREGMDPLLTNEAGVTPLHCAAFGGHLAVVAVLLAHQQHQENINMPDLLGNTPLHWASYGYTENRPEAMANFDNSYVRLVELLLKEGAHINAKNHAGNTPLHLAVREAEHALITVLVQAGADIDATNNDGDTPLHLAVRRTASEDTLTELMLAPKAASKARNMRLIILLLQAHAKLNVQNANGDSPVHVAAAHGLLETIEEILQEMYLCTVTSLHALASGVDASLLATSCELEDISHTIVHYAVQRIDWRLKNNQGKTIKELDLEFEETA